MNLQKKGAPQKIILLFLVVSFVIVLSWFSDGKMIASGEEGIPFYASSRILNISLGEWHNIDLGLSTPLYITRLPIMMIASLFQRINFSGVFIQGVVYWIVISTALIYSSKLYRQLLNKQNDYMSVVAAAFYIGNLFVASQVFARSILSLIFLWSFLPAFLYYFILWMENRKPKDLFLFVLFNIFFSQVYLIVSPVFVLWGSAFLYMLLVLYKKGQGMRTIFSFIIIITAWIISNAWWIAPFIISQGGDHGSHINYNENISSLKEVSKYFSNIDILTLKQKYYFDKGSLFYAFYNHRYLSIISITALTITICGFVFSKKNRKTIFIIAMFIIGWLLSKGSNPPLGEELFTFLFKYFPLSQAFRNPYEKLGVIFVLSYSFLFTMGINKISLLKQRFKPAFIAISLLMIYVLARPMLTGIVYSSYKVEVPHEYQEVNSEIRNISQEGRILQMPYATTADARLKWAPNVSGIYESLFDNASIPQMAIETNQQFYRDLFPYVQSPYFSNILKITDTCCVVLHYDAIVNKEYYSDVNGARDQILNWQGISYAKKYNDLELYLFKPEKRRVFLSNQLVSLDSVTDMLDKIVNKDFNPEETTFVIQEKINNTKWGSQIPDYSLEKRSNTQYILKIHNANDPFVVTLANSYNVSWLASIGGKTVNAHFKSNGFSNSWVIKEKGTFEIYIEFMN